MPSLPMLVIGTDMKLCVSAEDPELESLVAEEFGHADYFIIYDSETREWNAYPNEATISAEGSGIMAAEQVVKLGPEVVLTGFVGPHGKKILEDAGIKLVFDEDGPVRSSIDRWLKKQ